MTQLVVAWLFISHACFAAYLFRKVADTATAIPSGMGSFLAFDELAYDGDFVALRARGSAGQRGVYLWNGAELTRIVDTSWVAPGGAGTFTDFAALSLDDGDVAFIGRGSVQDGVYTTLGGSLRLVVNEGTTMPGSSVPFTQFATSHSVAIRNGEIALSGAGTSGPVANEGVYRESAGLLSVVADRSVPIPDDGVPFLFFNTVDIFEGDVFFGGGRGSGGGNGFYTTNGAMPGSVRTVLNANTSVPGLTMPISIVSPNGLRIDGDRLAFAAADSSMHRGIYIERNAFLEVIADTDSVDPQSGMRFEALTDYSISGGVAAFSAIAGPTSGLYLNRGGVISSIVRKSDAIDGKTVSSLRLFRGSLAHSNLAFRATFSDGSAGVYLAEPVSETSEFHAAAIRPLVDGQAIDGTTSDGSSRLDVLNDSHENGSKRAVMEFDFSNLPPKRHIIDAQLEIDVSLLTGAGGIGGTLTIHGYAGDGILSDADSQQTALPLGESSIISSLGKHYISLNAAIIDSLCEPNDVLGLLATSNSSTQQIGFRSVEDVLGRSTQLLLTYATTLDADFNGDRRVDIADFQVWRANFGSLQATKASGDSDGDEDADGADFLHWQREQKLTSNFAVAPEPNTVQAGVAATTIYAAITFNLWRRRCGRLSQRTAPPRRFGQRSLAPSQTPHRNFAVLR